MPAHNTILQTLADTGLIGMGGVLLFFVGIMETARRALRSLGERTGIGLFGVVTFLIGMVQTNLRDSEFMMAFWFLLALLLAYVGERSSDKAGDML
jgi:O-antigen ligase